MVVQWDVQPSEDRRLGMTLGGTLEHAPDAVLIVDARGCIEFVNAQAVSMFGYSREELQGQLIEVLVPEHLRERHVGHRARYADEPHVRPMGVGLDLSGRHKDGSLFPVEVSLSPIPSGDGMHIICAIRDATERRRVREELQRQADMLGEQARLLQARVRQQGAVAELGRQALSGIDLGALMDEAAALVARNLEADFSNLLELLPDGTVFVLRAGTGWAEGLVGHATLTADAGLPASYALLAREPVIVEDLPTDARFSGASILLEHGVVSGASTVIPGRARPYGSLGAFTSRRRLFTQDDLYFLQSIASMLALAIERKRHEQEQRERDLQRADQMATVGQVAAGVAHELRNPLTSIKGLVQVNLRELRARGLPIEDLQIIEQEIRRMERSLQAFLDFARPPRPERHRVEVAPLVERTLALIRGRAEKQGVSLRFRHPVRSVRIDADGGQIQQLVLNLALNALDAMPQGGSLEIRLRPLRRGWVELRVADSGPGIDPALLPRIFEPFISGKEAGLGLGLAISRRIAEDHGGSLAASDRPDGGAGFVLRLPASSA